MLPDNTALVQTIATATARLHAQIRCDIATLRQLVDDSWQLIEDVRDQRATRTQVRTIGLADQHTARE
jgi:hypothetical protein